MKLQCQVVGKTWWMKAKIFFYHPNQADGMHVDNDGLDIDPKHNYPNFSNKFSTYEVYWLMDNWFYMCVFVCLFCTMNEKFCFQVFVGWDDLLKWVRDLR